jgi:hypothetical protein
MSKTKWNEMMIRQTKNKTPKFESIAWFEVGVMVINKTCNILCLKKNVCAIFSKCFPKDDEPLSLKIVWKEGCKHVLLRKKGCILVSIGLGSKLKLLTPINFNKK